MNWYLSVLRPCIQRIIKVIVAPKAFGQEEFSGEEIEAAKSVLFDNILKRVDGMLGTQKFLIMSNEPTVIDIIFYNEISTALLLTRVKGFRRQFPRVESWITLMGEVNELNEMDEKLVAVIEKYSLE